MSNSLELRDEGLRLNCGHTSGTVCLRCSEEIISQLSNRVDELKIAFAQLNGKLETYEKVEDEPLCWTCKFGACSRVSVPRQKDLVQEKEDWRVDSENPVLLWQIVCSFPVIAPGIFPNKFFANGVLNCNRFISSNQQT